ncbi:ABC transporter ATP-binding protein [Paenibacillus lentus]|uniref:ATP-binding cassette domain-containing protein n=1 Tax=Paenibacillus lentus TaxID=1338368 RepID=A0A3S8RYH7_9BACL|nr:ATP-binding cassette domain-containing protein [Paenibacillus lentus]AZK48002.1 ATP-binding cassette domain-containing protein [Paenibacillus lentus]
MIEVDKVTKQYGRRQQKVTAIRDVTITIREHEIFALIGESGSGKSTLAAMIAGLEQPSKGKIVWRNIQNEPVKERIYPRQRTQAQMVFQNPDRSLNPYWDVKDIVAEPLILKGVSPTKAYHHAAELLERVHLPLSMLARRPGQCSGGQKQRIAIARAIALAPAVLIADEITSALDPETEQDILKLLVALKREQSMAILYITHRLETISGFADRMAVMKDGLIVEEGQCEQILQAPKTDYTRALLKACSFA